MGTSISEDHGCPSRKNGKKFVTQERVREVLDYNQETGILTWKKKPSVKASRAKIGEAAGRKDVLGYIMIRLDGEGYNAGFLAWIHATGEFPPEEVDHKNRIRDDNRFFNLRLATRHQNVSSRNLPLGATSQYRGVRQYKKSVTSRLRWMARIQIDTQPLFLGYFDTEELAARAYDAAAKKHLGEFAVLNFPEET